MLYICIIKSLIMTTDSKIPQKEPYYKYAYGKFKLAGYTEDGQTADTKITVTRNKHKSNND